MKPIPFALGLLALVGCHTGFSLLPDTRSVADRAHELDSKCRDRNESTSAAVLAPTAIDSVEALGARVQSGNSFENRLLGAQIHVRPLPGLTVEALALELQCHEASVALGRSVAPIDDPYSAPETWLDIAAESEGNGFVAKVQSFDYSVASAALARAKRYAATEAVHFRK